MRLCAHHVCASAHPLCRNKRDRLVLGQIRVMRILAQSPRMRATAPPGLIGAVAGVRVPDQGADLALSRKHFLVLRPENVANSANNGSRGGVERAVSALYGLTAVAT
jgi:hypothetical protein